MQHLRALVIGAGYLGSFHAEKYAQLAGVTLAGVADLDSERAQLLAGRLGTRAVTDFAALLAEADLASVVVPPEAHHAVAARCLEAGLDVLLEKPMTETIAQARDLIERAARGGRILQVGHLERFNPALAAAQGRIGTPLFVEAHRLAAYKPRGTEVDVVLDLMVHDIDIVLSLVRRPVCEVRAVGVPVLSDSVDIANARIEFEGGCVANLTASRVSQAPMRKLRLFQHDGYVSLDLLERRVTLCQRCPDASAAAAGPFTVDTCQVEPSDALRAEIAAFVESVRTRTSPVVTGLDGLRALEVALKVRESL